MVKFAFAKPSPREIAACLHRSAGFGVHPKTVICMGAIAAVAILGSGVRVMRNLGAPLADNVLRPRSSLLLLRLIDPTDAREQFMMFVRDLRLCRIERRTAGAIAAVEMSLRCLIKSSGSIPIDRVAGATHNQDVVNAGCRRSAKN
jgi:hypothetical protein